VAEQVSDAHVKAYDAENAIPSVGSARASINRVIDAPWLLQNELRRIAALPYIRLRLGMHGVTWGRGWRVFGMPVVQRYRGSTIVLGDHLILRSWRATNPLMPMHPVVLATRSPDARLIIGSHCGLTGTTIVAASAIIIGDRVLIGSNATIIDTDFHPLPPDERRRTTSAGECAPVTIHDDVFIGANCLILKGVTIGRGSVIGAGSVVSRDVPAGAIVAGNPARVVRRTVAPAGEMA
jgi:acetyltransferase-like isoleucine patch superfamily enzyme